MKLKDIFEVEKNQEILRLYKETYDNLSQKYKIVNAYGYSHFSTNQLFEDYNDVSSYARRTHSGKIKDGIELSELEISMICDNGYSHFGGSSSISSDGRFTVVIYTD